MLRKILQFTIFLLPLSAVAQPGTIQSHCYLGGTQAAVSGLKSTNYLDGIVPSCTVSVYFTQTSTLAPIFSAPSGPGGVSGVIITAGGSYSVCPTGVTFTGGGGTGAAGTPICTAGAVTGVAMSAAGSGYASVPAVAFTGGTGSGATGTATTAPILSSQFTANAVGTTDPGGWIFWAACGSKYDVTMNGGIAPNVYANPVTLTGVSPNGCGSGSGGGGGSSGPMIETNGTPNAAQNLLNFTNASPFDGLQFSFSNPSGGVETLLISGTLNNSGLTNDYTTVSGTPCVLGSSCTLSAGQVPAVPISFLAGLQQVSNQIFDAHPIPMQVTVPSGCTLSGAQAYPPTTGGTVPTATGTVAYTFQVVHSGTPTTFCTFTWSPGGSVATVTGSGGTVLPGDQVEFVGQSGSPDGTLQNVGAAVYGLMSGGILSGGGTINAGSNYALPAYGLASSSVLGPSNVTTDSTGNNLNVPGTLRVGSGAVLFSALPTCNTSNGPMIRSVSDVSGAGSLTWGTTVTSGTGTAATPITFLACDEVHWTVFAQ